MIGKISKGYSFRSLADYLLLDEQRKPRGRIIGGPMAGKTPRELSREFGKLRALNPKLNRAVAHFVLSPSPDDPALSDETFQALSEEFMHEMGFGNAPWCAVAHNDSDHPHIHIMASRIDLQAKTISDAGDYRRSEKAIRLLELRHGLTVIDSPPINESGPKPRVINSGAARRTADRRTNKAKTNAKATTKETAMKPSKKTPANPFPEGSPQGKTWPEPYEPGRDAAELTMIDSFAVSVIAASCGDELTDRKRREIRRTPHEFAYEQTVQRLFPDDPPAIFRNPRGIILYFHQPQPNPGRLIDRGDKLIARGGMSDEMAAKRIVALALSPERGWKSICFDGSNHFVELAMREAMVHGLAIHTKGPDQAEILARLIAEKRGGFGSSAGPGMHSEFIEYPELGDLYLQEPILAPLRELDKLTMTGPATPAKTPSAPAPKPVQPILPPPLSIREKLKERIDRQKSNGLSEIGKKNATPPTQSSPHHQ